MRLYVYPNAKAQKAIAVLECSKVTKARATVPAHVNLDSIQPGMVCHPGEGREVDTTTTYIIRSVVDGGLLFEGAKLEEVTEFDELAEASEEGQAP